MTERLNAFQESTSASKLRGEYYTPPELVRLVLERVAPGPGDFILDPSCGDGEFLVGAAEHYERRGLPAPRLFGLDVHPEAVAAARERVAEALRRGWGAEAPPVRIEEGSALDLPGRELLDRRLDLPEGRLLVLGNPPYVESKRLDAAAKQRLRRLFPDAASGAPDLYLYFLHNCLDWLREGDELALVLPNKVLVNANGRALRDRLIRSGGLRGIDFATQAGLFEGAAVYPIVLYAGAGGEPRASGLAEVRRTGAGLVRRALPDLPAVAYAATESRAYFPPPESPVLRDALVRLVGMIPDGRLDDVLDIRWTVSFHRAGLRERYVFPEQPPGRPHARPFLGGGAFSGNGEVVRYSLQWAGWWIDYDEERLRQEHNQLPPGDLFRQPKIAICQNGRTLRTAFDTEGYVLKDTFLCGLPRAADHPLTRHPRALVGLLCSRLAHFFYAHVFYGGHVNGGYLHFLRSFLQDIPLGHWSDAAAAELSALAQRRAAAPPSEHAPLEDEIEALVAAAFSLTPEEGAEIRSWCDSDANWQSRDRTRPPRRTPEVPAPE